MLKSAIIKKLQELLEHRLSDENFFIQPLENHDEFVEQCASINVDTTDLETIFVIFSYLKHYIVTVATQNNLLEKRYHRNDLTGYEYNMDCIPEEKFEAEISIMKELQTRMHFSQELRDAMTQATENFLAYFKKTNGLENCRDFLRDPTNWDQFQHEEIQGWGSAFICFHTAHAAEIFGIEIPAVSVSRCVPHDPQMPGCFYLPASRDNSSPLHIVWNPEEEKKYDPESFLASMVHENIHYLLDQICSQTTEPLPKMVNDGDRLKMLLKDRYVSGSVPLLSIYFNDPEETICYQNQKKVDDTLAEFISDLPELDCTPQHPMPS